MRLINRMLVANRAEIASRVFATCRNLGIETVAVCSDADADLPYVGQADQVVHLPGNTPAETYLRGDLVLAAARKAGADAIHPGYGFLSENAEFARAVEEAGLIWVGPRPESITAMGSKIEAKQIMAAAGVPVLEAPGDPAEADLPLLVKASAGGGGRGMRVVRTLATLDAEIAAAAAEAESAFGDGTVFVEPYVENGRHVEAQIVGDGEGEVYVVGLRDCSVQRRHQKVIEEAPAPGLPAEVSDLMVVAARAAGTAINYRGAGTVEFLYDPAQRRFFFLEMNTRLQVEHPVTELVAGVDLVAAQISVAQGGLDTLASLATRPTESQGAQGARAPGGHAIEARIYAEDPADGYLPQIGTLTQFEFPPTVRVDAGFVTGSQVSPFYDAMLAKVIAHGATRAEATRKLLDALRKARIHGLKTNRDQLIDILASEQWSQMSVHTGWLDAGGLGPNDAGVTAETLTSSLQHHLARAAATVAVAEAARAARTVQQGLPVAWRNVVNQPQRTEFDDPASDATVVVEWYGGRDGYVLAGEDAPRVVSIRPQAAYSTGGGSGVAYSTGGGSTVSTEVVLEHDGLRTRFDVTVTGDVVDVDAPYGHTSLRRTARFVDPASRTEPGSLTAPMPGSVTQVLVAEGAEVTEGQPILVMEAMKMQHTVTAPMPGVVNRINVEAGSQVAAGDVLAHVDGPEAGEGA